MILDNESETRELILTILRASPRDYDIQRTRWRLGDILSVLQTQTEIGTMSISALHNWLYHLGISYRQGWEHMTSPDPHLELKLSVIEHALELAQTRPDQIVVLWLDELTVYRLPSTASVWGDDSGRPVKAYHTPGDNTCLRIGGALNTQTGQVTQRLTKKFGSVQLRAFYRQIRQTYPDAQHIFVIQDCWPVHFLPEVRQKASDLGIRLLPLPTYSSWRNPIEKLWRWLKQTVIHMHSWADDWQRLQEEIRTFLSQFQQGSSRLLHYVGLSD